MSRCNVIQRTGLDFCVINNFQGTFTHFHFMIFTQERVNEYVDSMSVKSSTVRCLSNAVVNVSRYCWELWKQVISSNFQNGTFEIITITVKKIVLIQVFFLLLLLNKKIKIKTRNTIVTSYYSKTRSTQNYGVPFLSCLGHGA